MRSLAEIRFRLSRSWPTSFCGPFRLRPARWTPFPRYPGYRIAAVAAAVKATPWASELLRLADRILTGHAPLFGTSIEIGTQPAWRRDFQSGIQTPPVFFRRLPYLDTAKCGDHKNIWELSRHQYLVLVAGFRFHRRSALPRFCNRTTPRLVEGESVSMRHQLVSALEVAFRALSWIWIFHFLGPRLDDTFRREFLTELYRHGLHLEYNLSLYFSPNTHLLGRSSGTPCHRAPVSTIFAFRNLAPDGSHHPRGGVPETGACRWRLL